jgi:hypothetical protein
MTGRDAKGEGGAPRDREEAWPGVDSLDDADSMPDLISPAQLLRYLDQPRETADPVEHDDEEIGDTSRLPRITRMPEGMRVEERRVGRAVAQWILHVRCECGRRWFELEAIDTTTCPRCGVLVYLDVDARSLRR